MPIDIAKRLLFIHIPKTGGSSVEKALELHPHQVPDAKEYLSGTGKHLQHLTYSEMLTLNRDEEIGNCKKFCIIRNPIDRFHSEFRWRKKIGHPLTKEMDEYDFALHLLNRKKEGNLHTECHFRFQSDYFYINGSACSAIQVFRLEEGMEKVEKWINDTFDLNIEVSHANSTKSKSKVIDSKVDEVVKEIYKEDADLLGYEI